MALIGRAVECARLGLLLDEARRGLGATLVLRGEAGIGKTALLGYATRSATGFRVLEVTGVESEQGLPYASLHRLLLPLLDDVEQLPAPQREALESALGLAELPPPTPFLVGLGALNLAVRAAATSPMLSVVDDAQWLDRESLDALAFWGRRLQADGAALLFGVREGAAATSVLDGFDTLAVQGLSTDDACALLTAATGGAVDRGVQERIAIEMAGNPLALLDLAAEVGADRLADVALAPEPLPLSHRLEEHYLREIRALPIETQTMLLVIATESTGNAAIVARAGALLGVEMTAATDAEAAGLLRLGATVQFRHPLIRSAVYGAARPADRRAVHRALAAATDAYGDADRMAWHLAAATVGRDEHVAGLLESAAERACEHGGLSSAAALFARAAELSPEPERAAERRVAGAANALAAGAPVQVHALIDAARPDLLDAIAVAQALRLDGSAYTLDADVGRALPLLLEAATALGPRDPRAGRETLLEALEALILAGAAAEPSTEAVRHAVATALEACPPGGDALVDQLVDGFAACVLDGFVAAAPRLRRAIVTAIDASVTPERLLRWSVLLTNATQALWEADLQRTVATSIADVSRVAGGLHWLYVALWARGLHEMWIGRFSEAELSFAEAADIARAAGTHELTTTIVGIELLANRGDEAATRAKGEAGLSLAGPIGQDAAVTLIHAALLRLELGFGRYGDACSHAKLVFDHDNFTFGNTTLSDTVEAAARAGDLELAERALERFGPRAESSGSEWARGLFARSAALVAGDDCEARYQEAIERLDASSMTLELARSHLLYGEWLRRARRPRDAREQLRSAHDMFSAIGAEAFATRARGELLATGERVRRRAVNTTNDLTPQEMHVARLAADGETNAEIAARLFISVNTVEYHLRKVFRKLGITSRRQLRRALPAA